MAKNIIKKDIHNDKMDKKEMLERISSMLSDMGDNHMLISKNAFVIKNKDGYTIHKTFTTKGLYFLVVDMYFKVCM